MEPTWLQLFVLGGSRSVDGSCEVLSWIDYAENYCCISKSQVVLRVVEMEYVSAKPRMRWWVGVRGTLDADRGAYFLSYVTSGWVPDCDLRYRLSRFHAPTVPWGDLPGKDCVPCGRIGIVLWRLACGESLSQDSGIPTIFWSWASGDFNNLATEVWSGSSGHLNMLLVAIISQVRS